MKRKSNDCTSSFILATLQIVLGLKKLLGTKGPFGGNVFIAFLQSLSCTLVGRIEHIQSRGQIDR